jgi:hypothetical protein
MANYLSLPFCPGRQTEFIEHYDQSNHQYTFHTITPKLNCNTSSMASVHTAEVRVQKIC